ncbi:Aminomethyltransferase folate-binding domain-containing protein [Plenodomus tracheiphilus IPT5]|uniref:Iron-sulfur cluster assembly factor IBA57 homolog, mitochondrial n=1 Tax=Plenodomus tracheiphilus IPT5 TaxID=1408161 RepID=A0A6A7B807_9PLEO|nr:Aminomethyltransferase folate-binding domain-containing protein [Plenodomus tracheiphilus IPT5]
MSALLPRPYVRKGGFVCDSCLRSARALQRSQFATASPAATTTLSPRLAWQTRSHPAATRQSRFHSSTRLPTQPRASGTAPLTHRTLIAVSGPDAGKFLQGLITNNVDTNRQAPFYAAFLDARGRVLWDVFIWVWPELVADKGNWACYIEVDQTEAAALKKHLKRHKLRSKVVIEDVDHVDAWAAWGDAPAQVQREHIISELQDPRAPGLHRYLMSQERTSLSEEIEPVDTSEYHLQRYSHGIPEGPVEIPRESALPMECNIDLSSGIDFKKGCYVGQELTIRTKHTGVVRKRILPVRLEYPGDSVTPPVPGTDIKQLDEQGNTKRGRATGKFIAGVGQLGLALCRLEMMTSMKISAEGGSWKPDMHFGVETEHGVVKVKPVLHDWFVLRERNLWDKKRSRV